MNRYGFTLMELLFVVAILAIVMAIGFSLNRQDQRGAEVTAAAEELAATLREARSLAMKRKAWYAVSFNIANPVDSDGKVLSNRTGGHWYRIIGPDEYDIEKSNNGQPTFPMPTRKTWGANADSTKDRALGPILDSIARSWVGPRHVLPPNKVRFLALTDLDNGCYMAGGVRKAGETLPKTGDTYPPTYPRPWFGTYESGRLYPWGGYDSTMMLTDVSKDPTANKYLTADKDDVRWDGYITSVLGRQIGGKWISYSGFYYEGDDGTITGSKNSFDRWIYDDNSQVRDGLYWWRAYEHDDKDWEKDEPRGDVPPAPDESNGRLLLKAGESRPLINADWYDFTFIFYPDGHVEQGPFLWLRNEFSHREGINNDLKDTDNIFFGDRLKLLGPGDMCSQSGTKDSDDWTVNPRHWQEEAATCEAHTGTWWVTLAPEAGTNDNYSNAGEAVRSMLPACRVGINRFGDVRVIRVSAQAPAGTAFDTTITGTDWNKRTVTDQHWYRNRLGDWTTKGFVPQGMPVETFLTPNMLQDRSWWMVSP